MISAPVRLSRLPVGSSASTRDGSPTMARAMATRWRSPPDSFARPVVHPVAEADPLERRCGPRAAAAARLAGVHQPDGHVLHRRQPLDEVELLEDEAEVAVAQRREVGVAERGDVVPAMCTRPDDGTSSAPTRFSSVLFPDPDGPTMATNSPCPHGEGDAVEGAHRAAIRGTPSRRRRAPRHRAPVPVRPHRRGDSEDLRLDPHATTTVSPAATVPVTWT